MAIKISQGFKRTSNEPIDETLTLTKAQMKAVDDSGMPEKYFTICQDDGKLYLYDKENTVDEQTGKFRILEGGSGGESSEWGVAKVGITTVTFNNSKWATSSTIDVSDLGFKSGSDYEVLTQPVTGGTVTPWGSSISFIQADKGATSFRISAYTMEDTGDGTINAKYIIFAKGYGGGSGVPAGGTAGQILAKNSDNDGDAGWTADIGRDLNKLVAWGSHTSQSPRTEYVPDITDATAKVILNIPIQGSALQGIEATEESLKNYLKTRFKIRYQALGTELFTTTAEDEATGEPNSFGMKTNLISGYAKSRLEIFLDETTISNNTLHLAVRYYVQFSATGTSHRGKPTNVVLVANNGYTFGIINVNDPYYIHNSTKIALDDLKINNFNVPTSWGVATSGTRQVAIVNKVGQFTVDIRDLNITNVNDYNVVTEVIGGGTGAWGDSNCYLWEKSTNRFAGSVTTVGNDVDRVNISYVVVAKGYGNLVSGGGGSVSENVVKASASTGAGNVDIFSINGTTQEYTPYADKISMDLRVIKGGTYPDMPQFNILTAGAGNSIFSKYLATVDYVDEKEPDAITNQDIDTIIFG